MFCVKNVMISFIFVNTRQKKNKEKNYSAKFLLKAIKRFHFRQHSLQLFCVDVIHTNDSYPRRLILNRWVKSPYIYLSYCPQRISAASQKGPEILCIIFFLQEKPAVNF